MITRVLCANRGEIARRVFATCRRLDLGTVAVFSDPDVDSPHVREADRAVRLPGSTPAETYLCIDLVVDAALRSGADAVHPGYGFLSENAEFARAVEAAGLTWIGPPPAAIEGMGRKVEAKALMAAADVPVLTNLHPDAVTAADLPVLVKASAGGGGRGMRIVTELAALADEVAAAGREAESAFGDGTVFIEPYVERGHHVEVQVLADTHGRVWAVGERECSIQRRHQKVVEEAPSPLVLRTAGLREQLFRAARAAAGAIGYVGAGTVEFLAADDGRFWFLETNTRLQVEHPVTEATTGLDLVAWQIAVADGERLPDRPPPTVGHAIEVRLYAEDPAAGWTPQSGTVQRFDLDGVVARFDQLPGVAGIRLDAGVEAGSVVGVHYDPMLAKVVSVAPNRTAAAVRLAGALAGARIHGLTTNRDSLVRILRQPAFLAGDTATDFLDVHDVLAPLTGVTAIPPAALAAALAAEAADHAASPVQSGLPTGWRNVASTPRRREFVTAGGDAVTVRWRTTRTGPVVEGDGSPAPVVVSVTPDLVVLETDGVRGRYAVARYDDLVHVDGPDGPVVLRERPRFVDPADVAAPGSLVAPMPGTVVRVGAAVGDDVVAGQPLVWLEAMKMEHVVRAPVDGVVEELAVTPGRTVDVGSILALVSARAADPL
ncbi:acetyl/propionyl/methylcrotonyl-CoA carboxylase subunit alpha [Jatrophihabitans sp. YIM 134969]